MIELPIHIYAIVADEAVQPKCGDMIFHIYHINMIMTGCAYPLIEVGGFLLMAIGAGKRRTIGCILVPFQRVSDLVMRELTLIQYW